MSPVHRRLIELVVIGKHRVLNAKEAREYEESRQYATNLAWREARVFNLMQAARLGKDWEWFQQLRDDYQKLLGE